MADHREHDAGVLLAQHGHGRDRQLDPLVRHEAAQHDEARGLVLGDGLRADERISSAVDHIDVVAVHAELGELELRRVRHDDVARPTVDTRREPGLQPPAQTRAQRTEDLGPLLAVDVVHQVEHRGPGEQRGPERQSVLHVDDDVEAAPPAQQLECCPRVDGEPAAAPPEPAPVQRLVRSRAGVERGEHLHVVAPGGQITADEVEESLRAAGLGVPTVAPAQEQHPQPGACVVVGVGPGCVVEPRAHGR